MRQMLKRVALLVASLFAVRGFIRWDARKRSYRVYSRGHSFLAPAIAGAAFEVLQANLPAVAAAAGTTTPASMGEVPMTESEASFSIYRADVTAPALVTGNATNSATINLVQRRAGAVVTTNAQTAGVFATLALVAGVNLPAGTPVAMAITGAPVLLPGDEIEVQVVQIGTGLALPVGTKVDAEIG